MAQNLNAEIISIGTEILLGEITDTNSVYIARSLRDLGINLYFMTSVGDNEARIANSISIALSRADIVITTGGLGPTVDDMTRPAVATATGRGLTFHQHLLDSIAERFAGFRATMTENNRRQAYLPDNAILIENPVGTAPCFVVEYEGKIVISLPGVPREMKFLMVESVIPFLQKRYQLGIIKAKVLRTAGIGESALDDLIGTEILEASNPTVGLAAHSGVVDMRITAKAENLQQADNMIATIETQLRERVGAYIFGNDKDTIEGALVALLAKQGANLSISETGIGEVVSQRVKRIPQGRDILVKAENFKAPGELVNALSLPSMTDLRDLATRTAETISIQSGSTIGIAVISDPDRTEDHADKDAGTAIAVYMDGKSRSRTYGFGGQSDDAQVWTGTWTLAMAWRMLQE
jgi:nicotinamide-nucleotide amidase